MENLQETEIQQEQKQAIGKSEVSKALEILTKYKNGKQNLENQVVENEKWFNLRHSEYLQRNNATDPESVSAWLLNSILNKHADAMDSYPEPNVLSREESDKQTAETLGSVLPVVLEQNNYEKTYSKKWYKKLKYGTSVEGVFWNNRKNDGLGDIDIKVIDLLNIFWEPGIEDIQDSRNVFTVELVDNDLLKQRYPQLEDKTGSADIEIKEYVHDDQIDTSDKVLIIDWYYKTENQATGKDILHYCKIACGELLFASENDPAYENGWYEHGMYPFIFDTMFEKEGTPCGFGFIDVMKSPQLYIDKLNQIVLKNALQNGRRRYFSKNDTGINEQEFADWSKEIVHFEGHLEDIREITTQPLSGSTLSVLDRKVEELKETSGNRDFSQGGTASGVTAASAIAALQEAGSKLSRDMNKVSYNAYMQMCYLCIELMRQFYDVPRTFRITGANGAEDYAQFDNSSLAGVPVGNDFGEELGVRKPIFDIKVSPQRQSPFSKISQNEMAKEFYGLGFFAPQNADSALACIDMMTFDNKQQVINKISQNGTMFQVIEQMQAQIAQLMAIIQGGAPIENGQPPPMDGNVPQGTPNDKTLSTNSLGDTRIANVTADTAKERAYNIAQP